MKVTLIPIVIGALGTVTKRIDIGTGGLGNKRTSWDHSNDGIIKIDQNTENSPGDLRRLAITQNPAKDHRLKLVRKTLKGGLLIRYCTIEVIFIVVWSKAVFGKRCCLVSNSCWLKANDFGWDDTAFIAIPHFHTILYNVLNGASGGVIVRKLA